MNVLFFLMLLLSGANLIANSHSFFTPRQLTTNSAFELSLINYDWYRAKEDHPIQWYCKPFFMESTQSKQLAQYFLPCNRRCILLDETGSGNVNPLWFSLISLPGTYYISTLSLAPSRVAYGGLFAVHVDLGQYLWVKMNTTAMTVKHTLNLIEGGPKNTGTIPGFANAYQAFNNPDWTAGRFPCSTQSLSGIDDIQIKVGYDICHYYHHYYTTEQGNTYCSLKKGECETISNHGNIYAVVTIPTGNKPTSYMIFEPLVGSRHTSLGFGFDGDYCLYQCDDDTIDLLYDFKYRYVFNGTERRSFDLCPNGDWSRYFLVVTQQEPLFSQPGINLLTLPAQVIPQSTIDLWLAFHYQHCGFNVELGYDFWWRQAEYVCPKCSIIPGYGIQPLAICSLSLTTASQARISQGAQAPNATPVDATFVPITNANLNAASAAHPAAWSNSFYGSFGYSLKGCSCDAFFGFGASYEAGNSNALSQWMVWYAQGISF